MHTDAPHADPTLADPTLADPLGTEPTPGAGADPVGLFTYAIADDRWTWSPEVFALFGYEPGEVVPTTGLALAHEHPDAEGALAGVLQRATASPGPFGGYLRLVDSRRRQRAAVVVGEHLVAPDDSVGRLRGFVLDVTERRRDDIDDAITAALSSVVASRSAIEQAKGALMAAFGIDANHAFEVLTWLSQRSNTKVRDLTGQILASLTGAPLAEEEMTEVVLGAMAQAAVKPSADDVADLLRRVRDDG